MQNMNLKTTTTETKKITKDTRITAPDGARYLTD